MIRPVTDGELRFGHKLYMRRSCKERDAFNLLPFSMQKNVLSNYPVAFTEHEYAYYPDFLFSKEKIIIEIDGYTWHHNAVERDRRRDDIFRNNGFLVIRVPASLVDNPFDFWFILFCEFAKLERRGDRSSLEKYINDLNMMVERLALTFNVAP